MKTLLPAIAALLTLEVAMISPAAGSDKPAAPASVVSVVQQGATRWKVHVPPTAGIVERFAADELKKYLRQMSGATLQETSEPDSSPVILVGLRKDLGDVSFTPPKSGFDGYAIHITPERIILAGDNPRGVLYAVYDLLEQAGCRWWHPTLDPKDPEVVPEKKDIVFAAGTKSESGRIELRVYNGSAFFFWIHCDRILPQIDWAAKNRFNVISWQAHHEPGSVQKELEQMRDCGALDEMDKRGLSLHGPCHSFPFFLPTEKYFDEHPEWFGLRDGKRRPNGGEWPAVNYCWSNKEANTEFIGNVVAFVKQWPQLKILNMVPIDGGIVCQCDKCQERGGSNLIIELFNRIADRLEETAPDVTLETVCGYGPMDKPPQGSQPNGKWQAVYAHWGRNHHTSYSDPEYIRRPGLLVWRSYFPRFEICSYYAASSHSTINGPPFLHALEGDTKFIIDHNITGHYVLHYPHGFWWNFSFTMGEAGKYAYYYPERAPKEELHDYALTYFGPKAGPLVAEYLLLLGSNENLDRSYDASNAGADEGDMEWFRSMEQLRLRAADLAAGDPIVSYRIKKLGSAPALLGEWGDGRQKVADAQKLFDDFQAGNATKEDVRKKITDLRSWKEGLKTSAEALAAECPGTLDAEWVDGWYGNRIITSPLDALEKKLDGQAEEKKAERPDHVAGPE